MPEDDELPQAPPLRQPRRSSPDHRVRTGLSSPEHRVLHTGQHTGMTPLPVTAPLPVPRSPHTPTPLAEPAASSPTVNPSLLIGVGAFVLIGLIFVALWYFAR
jgi:hypothetical protein